jgi:hypothetical protein
MDDPKSEDQSVQSKDDSLLVFALSAYSPHLHQSFSSGKVLQLRCTPLSDFNAFINKCCISPRSAVVPTFRSYSGHFPSVMIIFTASFIRVTFLVIPILCGIFQPACIDLRLCRSRVLYSFRSVFLRVPMQVPDNDKT